MGNNLNNEIPLQNVAQPNGISARIEEEAENRPKQKRSFHNEKVRTARMDLMFLILFPILFFIFNIVYWVGFLYVVPETETEGTVEWCSVCGTLGQKKNSCNFAQYHSNIRC